MDLNAIAPVFTDAVEQLLLSKKLNYFLYNRSIEKKGDEIVTRIEMKGSKHSYIFDFTVIPGAIQMSEVERQGDCPEGNDNKIISEIQAQLSSLTAYFK